MGNFFKVRQSRLNGYFFKGGKIFLTALLMFFKLTFADAATTTTTFVVKATVLAVCVAAATDLDFGDYTSSSASPDDASSTLTITCTNGQGYTVAGDAGISAGAAIDARAMSKGSDLLNYGLYTAADYATLWGDGTSSTVSFSGTGNGSPQNLTVYGRIPTGQYIPSGIYTDTITVTVSY